MGSTHIDEEKEKEGGRGRERERKRARNGEKEITKRGSSVYAAQIINMT